MYLPDRVDVFHAFLMGMSSKNVGFNGAGKIISNR